MPQGNDSAVELAALAAQFLGFDLGSGHSSISLIAMPVSAEILHGLDFLGQITGKAADQYQDFLQLWDDGDDTEEYMEKICYAAI